MDDIGDQKRLILVAGAKNVGKTALLAAIERSALQNRAGGPRLTFSPSLPTDMDPDSGPIALATDRYLSRVADFFLRGIGFTATEGPQSYDFKLGVQQEQNTPNEFQFVDAPGEYTSPRDIRAISEHRKTILKRAREGYALVFCFESLSESDPTDHLLNLEMNLSTLLSNLSSKDGRMNFVRILFLLTKIDIPVTVFHDRSSAGRKAFPLTPMQLAQRIDPLEQMRAIVGSENIAKFLYPNSDCEFAVGICSAFGFDWKTGKPMVCPYTNLPLMPAGRTLEEHYHVWTPFGVREALVFLTLGEVSPFVKRIQNEDPDFDDKPRSSLIPCRSRR